MEFIELLISVHDPWGIIIITLAGIWLSWSTKYIKKIVCNGAIWLQLRRQPGPRTNDEGTNQPEDHSTNRGEGGTVSHPEEPASEDTYLLGRGLGQSELRDTKSLAHVLKDKSGVRDLMAEVFHGGNSLTAANRWHLAIYTTIIVLIASGVIIGGYFSARIKVDGPARLYSKSCGLWLFEGEKRSEAATRARMLDLQKEERAAHFAEDCYRQSASPGSRCKLLYRPTLPVSPPIYTNDCPFASEICRFNQTVTFKTPLLDAKELGINSDLTPKFRRTTACTPLSMKYPYIQHTTTNGTTTYTYHYGQKNESDKTLDYTYRTVGDPWEKLAPIYDVFAYSSTSKDSENPVWIPHPDLTRPRFSTLTIIFISSLRILYEERSDDPLFPADKEYPLPGDPKPWFRNSDPRARPLACLDSTEVCSSDGRECWSVNESTENITRPDNTPEFILLYSSLYKADVYYSLAKRQGRALMAQKKVSQYFSAELGDDPWVAEVENLVWTALARTSINAWSVASGEDSIHEGKGGFTEVTKGYGDLCGKYKYIPQGYQSLRFIPIILVVTWLPFIWVLSWDAKRVDWIVKRPALKVKELCSGTVSTLKFKIARLRQGHDIQVEHQQAAGSTPAPATHVSDRTGDLNEENEDSLKWEPLVLWQLICCIWFLARHLGQILWLAICLLFCHLLGQFTTVSNDAGTRDVAARGSQGG